MPENTPDTVEYLCLQQQLPCPARDLIPQIVHSISGGEALLSEAELIRQLRAHGWMSGDPGTLIRRWSTKEVK